MICTVEPYSHLSVWLFTRGNKYFGMAEDDIWHGELMETRRTEGIYVARGAEVQAKLRVNAINHFLIP